MRKKIVSLLSIAALAFGLTACGSDADSSSSEAADVQTGATVDETAADNAASKEAVAQEDSTETSDGGGLVSQDVVVRVGYQGDYVIPVGLDKGWIEETFGGNNITFEFTKFNNGPEINEALTAGQLDVAYMGQQPAISGIANGAGDIVIGSFIDQSQGTVIVTAADSGIESIEDLKGKKVATTIGSSAHSLLLSSLEKHGLSISDIELVNVDSFAALPTVLESGEVDASAGYYTQYVSTAEADGFEFNYLEDASGYGICYCVIVANQEFAETYPDIIETGFVLADKTIDWIYENEEEALQINADFYGYTVETAKATLETSHYLFPTEQELRDGFTNYINFMLENGLLSTELTVDDILDLSYFEASGVQ